VSQPAPPLPAIPPNPGPDDAPFWEAAAQDRLVLPRCRTCETFIWYPRSFCPDCHAGDVEWTSASGHGTVYSYTVSHRGPGPWADRAPYVIAYVELDEGPRVLTNLVGANPEAVRIGDRVTAVFEPAGATKVLRFTPRR
jgi:uncharacterized OB-fold protein